MLRKLEIIIIIPFTIIFLPLVIFGVVILGAGLFDQGAFNLNKLTQVFMPLLFYAACSSAIISAWVCIFKSPIWFSKRKHLSLLMLLSMLFGALIAAPISFYLLTDVIKESYELTNWVILLITLPPVLVALHQSVRILKALTK